MTDLLAVLINGISIGGLYALIALGITITFKASGVLNFSLPGVLALSTYVVVALVQRGMPFLGAVAVAIVFAAVLSILVDRVLVSRFHQKQALFAASIMTIGLDILTTVEFDRRIGANVQMTGDPFGSGVTEIAGVTVADARLAALVVTIVLLVLLQLLLHKGTFGVQLRAAAEDREAAALMGVPMARISAIAWALAGILALVAGLFLAAYPSAGLSSATADVALRALPAVMIGGLDSTTGAIVGGLLVGLSEALVLGYSEVFSVFGEGVHNLAPYVLMLIVLLVRPAGLFGAREYHRV